MAVELVTVWMVWVMDMRWVVGINRFIGLIVV